MCAQLKQLKHILPRNYTGEWIVKADLEASTCRLPLPRQCRKLSFGCGTGVRGLLAHSSGYVHMAVGPRFLAMASWIALPGPGPSIRTPKRSC